ncbi:MAG: AMIN domain-containing protein, partial [Myxococcota bacterium]|nr:AMIN domain-containing protein [Myxococcota bacterium]
MHFHKLIRPIGSLLAVVCLALASSPLMGEETPITLTGVVLSAGGADEVEILLSGDVPKSSVSAFHLENPSRVVVDIVGVALGDVASEVAGEASALVRKVELTDFAEDGAAIVRASIHLGEAATHELEVEPGTIRVALSVGESTDSLLAALGATSESGKTLDSSKGRAEGPGTPSGPKNIDGLSLSSLDFIDGDTASRVVLGTTQSVDYVSSQPEPNLVVLDIPGAKVPRSLQRVLDTSRFVSPVRMVRAYATRSGARVAVSLRNNVPWTVSSGTDGLVHIDFTVPEEMQETRNLASQSFTESAPSEPSTSGGEDGLSGAYTSETLIGEAGRTMDPQAVFGSGRGAQ